MDNEDTFLVQGEWPQGLMQQMVTTFFERHGQLDPKIAKRLDNEANYIGNTVKEPTRRAALILQRGLQVTVTGLTFMGSVFGWRNVALLCLLISQEFTKFADEREGTKPH